jgi:Asp-tRNA(Asn)/Glu-tRNA(Gln) amidotransferase A subunit family amidase
MQLPRIHGAVLARLARVARTKPGAAALVHALRADFHLDELGTLPDRLRAPLAFSAQARAARPPRTWADAGLEIARDPAWSASSARYTSAYEARRATPEGVLERTVDAARALAGLSPSLGPILAWAEDAHDEAERSGDRYRAGTPRGPLDGVCIVIKEQMQVRGLPAQGGTKYRSAAPCAADATVAARLRAAGAIIVGTTPRTELGMSPLGVNPHRTMPRNPHEPSRCAGGSSTGSGVAVATGLVPMAIGADGGGSIRIPAAVNGVFGIKPTWGRVSRFGDDCFTSSVAHVGPIAGSVYDLAVTLEHIGAPDPHDPETLAAPALAMGSLVGALGRGVRGVRIGVDEREWAAADDAVARAGRAALAALEREGAILVPVSIELAAHAVSIGAIVIAMETRAGIDEEFRAHAADFGADNQIVMSVLEHIGGVEYLNALRLRQGLRRDVAAALREVDVLALPTTATTATSVTDAQMASSFLDPKAIRDACRFTFLANLTGLPAVTCPVGLDASALPIGLQLIGDAFDEASVLAVAAHLERIGAARVERPRFWKSTL